MTDCSYLIRSSVNRDFVELWSNVRLPFEPKGKLLEMRNSLREALKQVESKGNDLLHATFCSEVNEFFDLENILLYNVGRGPFAHLCRKGLCFERGPKLSLSSNLTRQIGLWMVNYSLLFRTTAYVKVLGSMSRRCEVVYSM